jgi:two-component system phosphate regulon response regulator PhoB
MTKEKILIVDDELDILELVSFRLRQEGYQVCCAATGEDALQLMHSELPDLIVLDLMLPGMDGLQMTSRLKHDPLFKNIPIVMLTAKNGEADIVTGLELGADDYITKPFSPRILIARVRAILRRRSKNTNSTEPSIRIDKLQIHRGRREVYVDSRQVDLTFSEFTILEFLAQKPGWVFSRSQIIEASRVGDYPIKARSVDVQILAIRRKLGSAGEYIETVRGVGYRLRA